MKWHKISDGDYPKINECVLVAFERGGGTYDELGCEVAIFDIVNDGTRWFTANSRFIVSPSDRWTYIDPPID